MTSTNPLNGPFMTATDLSRYDDEPGYEIRLPDAPSGSSPLSRLDRALARKAAA